MPAVRGHGGGRGPVRRRHPLRLGGAAAARTVRTCRAAVDSWRGMFPSRRRGYVQSAGRGPYTGVEACVHELVEEQVCARPEAAAVSSWDGELTYRELDALSNRLAAHLVGLGVGPETLVPLCFEKSLWAVVAMLAVLKAGAAFVPLNAAVPVGRLEQVVQATGALFALGSPQRRDLLASAIAVVVEVSAAAADHWPSLAVGLTDIPTVAAAGPTDVAYVIFISGSTGRPKGVVIEHQAVSSSVRAHGRAMHFGPDTRALHFASLGFDASITEILTTLAHGGCVCIADEEQRLSHLADAMNRLRVNWAFFTPPVVSLIEPGQVPHLKTLVLGGERVKEDDIEAWADRVELINGYGPTEACVFCVSTALRRTGSRCDSIGKAIGSIAWVVSQSNDAQLAAVGSIGELWIEGPQLARGYLGNEEATATAFVWNPPFLQQLEEATPRRLYRTGGLVRYHEDGSLVYVGRKDTQVKVRGQRVELGEIEHELRADERVEAAIVLFPDEGPFTGKVIAVISLAGPREEEQSDGQEEGEVNGESGQNGEKMAEKRAAADKSGLNLLQGTQLALARLRALQMRQGLAGQLPSYMVPTVWLAVESIPLTTSGKLDRLRVMRWVTEMEERVGQPALLALGNEGSGDAEGPTANAVTPTEHSLQQMCADVLGLPAAQVSMARSFMNHGGDSITAMQLASRCRAQGMRVSVQDILRSRTLSQLAIYVGTLEQSKVPRDEPLDQPFELSPVQQLYFGLDTNASTARFNQSFLVRLTRRKEVLEVARAVEALVSQHSMLRARLGADDSGRWRQTVTAEVQSSFEFAVHDVPQAQAAARMASIISTTQARINPQTGPVFAVDVFEVAGAVGSEKEISDTGTQVLFLVAHHLVVDLVSWRILLQQLEELLETGELSADRPVPFQVWTKLQAEYAERELAPEVALPFTLPPPDLDFWGMQSQQNTWGEVESAGFGLDQDVTELLLGDCNTAFNTEPVDLFTAALLHSFRQVFPEREVPSIFSEGHGREPWDTDIDLSGTVGWFTTMRPVAVPVGGDDDVLETLRRAKDARRATPSNGWAYFASRFLHPRGRDVFSAGGADGAVEVIFNYLGRFQQLERKEALLRQAPRVGGFEAADMGPETPRMSVIDVSASVNEGRVGLSITYSKKARYTARIAEWVQRCGETLATLTELLPGRRREYTVSDLPLLSLTQAGLRQLVHNRLPRIGVDSIDAVEEVYPCSPMQHGILVSQSKMADHYDTEFAFEATGRAGVVDIGRLGKAWQAVVDRHAMLRTVFIDGVTADGAYAQVVLKHAEARVVRSTTGGRDTGQDAVENDSPGRTARPAHRLAIGETADGRVECRLAINHALIDGASVAILFGDLALAYGGDLPATHGPLYRDYIAYLLANGEDAAVAYWAERLAGLEPCHFPRLADATPSAAGTEPRLRTVNLETGALAAQVQAFCAANDVIVSNVVHAAWAIVLRAYTGSEDVCFGYLTSGRDVPVDGVEGTIGPFIDILTARLAVQPDATMGAMVTASKDAHLQALPHQSCSLAKVQHALGLAGRSLFNTAVSVQTYPVGDDSHEPELSFRSIGGHDPTEVRQKYSLWHQLRAFFLVHNDQPYATTLFSVTKDLTTAVGLTEIQ